MPTPGNPRSLTPPGSAIPSAPVKGGAQQSQARVPFRIASLERTELLTQALFTTSAAQQPFQTVVEGTGFCYGIVLDVGNVEAGNGAGVAFFEDGPQSALAQVTLSDPTGDVVNCSGFDLFLANLAHKEYTVRGMEASTELFTAVTGAGATGGSYTFMLRVPVGINRRSLLGLLGNQDRGTKFTLRTDLNIHTAAATGPVYTTAPTNFGAVTINRHYENYSLPPGVVPSGRVQQTPDGYGTISFVTATNSESVPQGPATINHVLRRISNTIRYMILVLRSNNSRATAQTNAPTRIALKFGDADVFNETYRYRRYLMNQRYGFDWPNGILVYDAMHDFAPGSGNEQGFDWYNTQNINTAQFQITYPAGFGAASNSLRIITSDLALVGQPVGS